MLSTTIRTKIAILSDDREIAITNKQYDTIKADQMIGKFSDPIVIRDPDTKEILFDGKIWAIKEFRDIKNNSNWFDRYICDFATRHSIKESCECADKYWIFPIDFRYKMHEMFPNKHSSQLTLQEKNSILESFWEHRNTYKN